MGDKYNDEELAAYLHDLITHAIENVYESSEGKPSTNLEQLIDDITNYMPDVEDVMEEVGWAAEDMTATGYDLSELGYHLIREQANSILNETPLQEYHRKRAADKYQ